MSSNNERPNTRSSRAQEPANQTTQVRVATATEPEPPQTERAASAAADDSAAGETFLLPGQREWEQLEAEAAASSAQDATTNQVDIIRQQLNATSMANNRSWSEMPLVRTANINQQPLAEHNVNAVKKWAEMLRTTRQHGIVWRSPESKFTEEGWRQVRRALINGKLLPEHHLDAWRAWDDETLIKNVQLVLPEQGKAYTLMDGGQDVAEGLTRLAASLSGTHGSDITSAAPARNFIAKLEKFVYDVLPARTLETSPPALSISTPADSMLVIKLNRALLIAVERHMLGGKRVKQELREMCTTHSFFNLLVHVELANQRIVEAYSQLQGILPHNVFASMGNKNTHTNRASTQVNHQHKQQGQGNHKQPPPPKRPHADSHVSCTICGRTGHSRIQCRLSDHPDGNKESCPWADSAKGKAWVAKGRETLPFTETLSGAKHTPPTMPKTGTSWCDALQSSAARERAGQHPGGSGGAPRLREPGQERELHE